MALSSRVKVQTNDELEDLGYVSESAMENLCMLILSENLSPEEIEQFIVNESANCEIVTEKSIIKLDKAAKLNKAYKLAVLQCAAEDKRKEYAKLRQLWMIESGYFKKLEKMYKHKAMARAKEAVKKTSRNKTKSVATAGTRAAKMSGGAKSLLDSKPFTLTGRK